MTKKGIKVFDAYSLIEKYYKKSPNVNCALIAHSEAVAEKALEVARHFVKKNPKLKIDLDLIKEGALLHDIGIYKTSYPEIGLMGKEDYIRHGIIGAEILKKEGLPKHSRICERHIGVGLTKEDVKKQNLPLPMKDMIPKTWEEKIVCFADLFFSKTNKNLKQARTLKELRQSYRRFGKIHEQRLKGLIKELDYRDARKSASE